MWLCSEPFLVRAGQLANASHHKILMRIRNRLYKQAYSQARAGYVVNLEAACSVVVLVSSSRPCVLAVLGICKRSFIVGVLLVK